VSHLPWFDYAPIYELQPRTEGASHLVPCSPPFPHHLDALSFQHPSHQVSKLLAATTLMQNLQVALHPETVPGLVGE
jgi:hypothetical protein